MQAYWDFLSRPPPSLGSGIDSLPTLLQDSIAWTGLFCLAFELVKWYLKVAPKKWTDSLSAEKKFEWPSFAVCLLHHLRVVPLACIWIYQDLQLSKDDVLTVDYTRKEAQIASFCIGYLVADTIYFTFWEVMKGSYAMFIHHALILYLVLSTLFGDGSLCRFIPHLLICDATGIPFNLAFLLRTVGMRDSVLVKAMELSFVGLFFVFRVVNMPLMFYAMFQYPHNESLGYARYVIPPICVLQWFWFVKIFLFIFKKDKKPKDEKSS
jgi:hypothetical protein